MLPQGAKLLQDSQGEKMDEFLLLNTDGFGNTLLLLEVGI